MGSQQQPVRYRIGNAYNHGWLNYKLLLLFFLSLLIVPFVRGVVNNKTNALASTYYVSPTGSDSNDGTSIATAWQSIDAVNANSWKLAPGDQVLFEGGQSFYGSLFFMHCGTPNDRITISSYGSGKAKINAAQDQAAIKVYNCGGYTISNLVLEGHGSSTNSSGMGIEFVTDSVPAITYSHVDIRNTEVFGHIGHGIAFTSFSGAQASGYSDVVIDGNSVHDNQWDGIATWGTQRLSAAEPLKFSNFTVTNNTVFNNPGNAQVTWVHSGSGINLGQIKNSIIEHNEAYGNGGLNGNVGGGPVGIWAVDCDNILIQHNVSHDNHTGNNVDGGGFDIDGGCSNSTVQYNHSYNNDGSGYLIAQYDAMQVPMNNNTIRYNLSVNDARNSSNNGAINLWRSTAPGTGEVSNQFIYNNTVYLDASLAHAGPESAFTHEYGAPFKSTYIANNIFYVNGADLVRQGVVSDDYFINNIYFSTSSPNFHSMGIDHIALDAWRNATGAETYLGVNYGLIANPALELPGGNQFGHRITSSSPAAGSQLDLTAIFGLSGGRDFFGNNVPNGTGGDIGAHEFTAPELIVSPNMDMAIEESITNPSIYTVVLSTQPATDVVVNISDSSAALVLNTSTLTFTPTNWNIPQNVSVTASEDGNAVSEADQLITFAINDEASDNGFDQVLNQVRRIDVVDNDSIGFTITPIVDITLGEGITKSDAYQVTLSSQPASNVAINVSETSSAIVLNTSRLTFTNTNWNLPQKISITVAEEPAAVSEADQQVKFSIIDNLSDNAFDPLPDQIRNVDVIDNDSVGFTVTPNSAISITERVTNAQAFSVVLTSKPASKVVITIFESSPALTLKTASVTFSPNNWNVPKNISIMGTADANTISETNQVVTFSINDALSDNTFDPLDDQTRFVNVIDVK